MGYMKLSNLAEKFTTLSRHLPTAELVIICEGQESRVSAEDIHIEFKNNRIVINLD